MAGKTSSQITAAAPAPTPAPSVPAAVEATGPIESQTPPPAPTPEKAKPKAVKTPTKGMATNATPSPDTSAQTQADFESAVADFEKDYMGDGKEGKADKGKEKAASLKEVEKTKPTEKDEIQADLDAAAEAAGIKKPEVAEPEKAAEKEVDTEVEEVEPPDAEADGDAYEAWIKTLSKPAAKKIQQQRGAIAKAREAAAAAIMLQPTAQAPLSHITNLEQLEAQTAYWKDVRAQAKTGEVVKITGVNGKKLELDPEIEEDAKIIEGYAKWAETAIEQAPDARERIRSRQSSKPWEAAEKLAPGMISDKESFAHKKAMEVLKSNGSLAQDPNYEVHLGHMVRSYQMDEDQKPTEAYPKGKAKWVRLPLDKEGNVIPPKKAVASTKDAGKKPPTAVDSKPAVVAKTGSQAGYAEALTRAETSGSMEDLTAAMKAALS